MELKSYIKVLQRWAWILVLGALLGALVGYGISRVMKPSYQATTKILLSKDPLDQTSQFATMTTQQFVGTYLELLTTTSVIDEASRRLNFPINVINAVQVQQVQTTPILQINTLDSDPQRAAAIGNTLVEVLIDQNEQATGYQQTEDNLKKRISQIEDQISTIQSQFNQLTNDELQSQLKQVDEQIATLEVEILNLKKEIAQIPPTGFFNIQKSVQLAEKQAQLDQLQPVLTQYQQIRTNLEFLGKPSLTSTTPSNYAEGLKLQELQATLDLYQKIHLNLMNDLESVQLARLHNTPTIVQIEKAVPPIAPIQPLPFIYTILAATAGLILALGIAFISEYLDDTYKTPQEIERDLGLSVLGKVAETKSIPGQVVNITSEEFYALRTNIEFSLAGQTLKSMLVVDVLDGSKGKTNVAADLAMSYARSGSKVVLIDADMMHPTIYAHFGLTNETGFSDLLSENLKIEVVSKKVDGIDGLTVITAGKETQAVEELIKSEKIVPVLDKLKKQSDVVVIDSPEASGADAWVLASKVDGVLLVIRQGQAHPDRVKVSLEQLKRAGVKILGTVLCSKSRGRTMATQSNPIPAQDLSIKASSKADGYENQ